VHPHTVLHPLRPLEKFDSVRVAFDKLCLQGALGAVWMLYGCNVDGMPAKATYTWMVRRCMHIAGKERYIKRSHPNVIGDRDQLR
jgi:hypothetical protein